MLSLLRKFLSGPFALVSLGLLWSVGAYVRR